MFMQVLYQLFVCTGTVPTVSSPMSTGSLTTSSIVSNNQASISHASTHTQLKVPNPATIQLRPQVFTNLQSNNMAMAMQTRLSLPFQTTVGQNLTVPTTLNTLRSLQPSTLPSSPVLSHPMQFQTMSQIRGGAVSMTGTSQPQSNQQGHQQLHQQQPMSIRPFPLLLNRPLALTGRPQLITAAPTRLAPRPLGSQGLQVPGHQSPTSATLVPLFRPSQAPKVLSAATQPIASAPAVNVQGQFVNQVVAVSTGNQVGVTHISFQPPISGTKVLERPGKMPEARLIPSVTTTKLIRPNSIGGTNVASSSAMVDTLSGMVKPHETVSSASSVIRNGGIIAAAGASMAPKHLQDSTTNTLPLVGEPPVKMSFIVQPSVGNLKEEHAAALSTATPLSHEDKVPGQAEKKDSDCGEKKDEQSGEKNKKSEDVPENTHLPGDFDAAKAMEWNDGIGTLPGSNLKVRRKKKCVLIYVCGDMVILFCFILYISYNPFLQ